MIEPGVRLIGDVQVGQDVDICAPAELMAKGSRIVIGDGCDIAAFCTITTASSHKRCLGLSDKIERREIVIGDHCFVGTGAVILGGSVIGHHSVIGAGVVLRGLRVPPWSRVTVPPPIVEPGFYRGGVAE